MLLIKIIQKKLMIRLKTYAIITNQTLLYLDIIMFFKTDTISTIKKNLNSKIILWYEDALAKSADGPSWQSNLNLIEKNHDLIDCYFITTHPRDISETIINKKKINFLPMLVDENIENLHLFEIKNKFKDLFFAISHGVNFGKLKKNKIDEREIFVNKLLD